MRLAQLVGLGVALTAAAGGAQQPSAPSAPTPELTLWSPSSMNPLMTVGGLESFFVSVDRDAYVAAFEVGRDGRMRVLYPRSPKEAGRVKGGKTVSFVPWSYDILGAAVAPTDVPYVIALASDDPIDLSRFGQGKTWQYRVRLDESRDTDVTMENVARLVARDTAQRFAGDFSYVAPRISPSTQLALARCTSLTSFAAGRDGHDYWMYRDLWMSFGPRDGFWFASVSPWLGWGWSGFAPMLFPSVAAWPTRGGGCSPTLRLPTYADVTPPPPVRIDSTRRDSTRVDSVRAGAVGRTIAVEQPRGVDATEAQSPAESRRFSPAEIARIRAGFYGARDGDAASGAAIAGRHAAAPTDRRGAAWAPEPMDARPTSRGGSRYAEAEESDSPRRWPTAPRIDGVPSRSTPSRNDPERASAATGSSGWQRPTSVGGGDVTRAAAPSSPVAAPSGAASGAAPRTPASPAAGTSTTPPKGQQQNQ